MSHLPPTVAAMTTFVLVPGAWMGGWVWQPVTDGLRAHGHRVHPVTLPGLAERAAEMPIAQIGLATHVQDLLVQLERVDARESVLVGHSYAGIVAGLVADLARDRVAHTVFVDANLPQEGRAMTDGWSRRGRELLAESVAANEGRCPVPEVAEFDGHDLSEAQIHWLVSHATGHPGRTFVEPARLTRPLAELDATFITCLRPQVRPRDDVAALHHEPGWSFDELDTGHWPMVSDPVGLTDLLLKAHHV